jgi:hypothetical protein
MTMNKAPFQRWLSMSEFFGGYGAGNVFDRFLAARHSDDGAVDLRGLRMRATKQRLSGPEHGNTSV